MGLWEMMEKVFGVLGFWEFIVFLIKKFVFLVLLLIFLNFLAFSFMGFWFCWLWDWYVEGYRVFFFFSFFQISFHSFLLFCSFSHTLSIFKVSYWCGSRNVSSQGRLGKCGLCVMEILFSFGKWDLGCVLFLSKGWRFSWNMISLPPYSSLGEKLIHI